LGIHTWLKSLRNGQKDAGKQQEERTSPGGEAARRGALDHG